MTLLLLCIRSIGQIYSLDSTHFVIEKEEFKHIIQINIEKNYQDSTIQKRSLEVDILRRIVIDKDGIIKLQDDTINILKTQHEELKPPFYDHFYIGVGTTILVYLTYKLLSK
jgi:hypothetical protein